MATTNLQLQSRLLSLPAELRTRIYEYTLAPTGTISHFATSSKRFATNPILAPALLRTCRQIHSEAAHILCAENRVCISIDAHDTAWPVIAEARLPQRVLESLQHVFLMLDCTGPTFHATVEDVDWLALRALVQLKTVRVAVLVLREAFEFQREAVFEEAARLLAIVLTRIPGGAEVIYGSGEGVGEADCVHRTIEKRWWPAARDGVMELEAEDLAVVAASLDPDVQQGSLSGGVEDVFAEYHEDRINRYKSIEAAI